ncbi:Nose resistant to fluoxetine protein 6 [Sarcoptes scabiei]|nr:Nose resistant to fluoxetine protein 6 [Sarcoptes scabiei]
MLILMDIENIPTFGVLDPKPLLIDLESIDVVDKGDCHQSLSSSKFELSQSKPSKQPLQQNDENEYMSDHHVKWSDHLGSEENSAHLFNDINQQGCSNSLFRPVAHCCNNSQQQPRSSSSPYKSKSRKHFANFTRCSSTSSTQSIRCCGSNHICVGPHHRSQNRRTRNPSSSRTVRVNSEPNRNNFIGEPLQILSKSTSICCDHKSNYNSNTTSNMNGSKKQKKKGFIVLHNVNQNQNVKILPKASNISDSVNTNKNLDTFIINSNCSLDNFSSSQQTHGTIGINLLPICNHRNNKNSKKSRRVRRRKRPYKWIDSANTFAPNETENSLHQSKERENGRCHFIPPQMNSRNGSDHGSYKKRMRWTECDADEVSRLHRDCVQNGQPLAPYNTSQFIMNEHSNDIDFEALSGEIQQMRQIKQQKKDDAAAFTASSTLRNDSNDSNDLPAEDYYSSPEDESFFLEQQFHEAYDTMHAERLNSMSKSDLLKEFLIMEKELEILKQQPHQSITKNNSTTEIDVSSETKFESTAKNKDPSIDQSTENHDDVMLISSSDNRQSTRSHKAKIGSQSTVHCASCCVNRKIYEENRNLRKLLRHLYGRFNSMNYCIDYVDNHRTWHENDGDGTIDKNCGIIDNTKTDFDQQNNSENCRSSHYPKNSLISNEMHCNIEKYLNSISPNRPATLSLINSCDTSDSSSSSDSIYSSKSSSSSSSSESSSSSDSESNYDDELDYVHRNRQSPTLENHNCVDVCDIENEDNEKKVAKDIVQQLLSMVIEQKNSS